MRQIRHARRRAALFCTVVGMLLLCMAVAPRFDAGPAASRALPARLTDEAFWRLSQDSSEPGGTFRSLDITNLTSNEMQSQWVIPDLAARVPSGAVYLGVGPEQNFTYIAALRPSLAVIFDIRRGNLDLQLMYKAIFELCPERADFVSMLFSLARPAGVGRDATADALFAAFGRAERSDALYGRDLQAILDRLTHDHGFTLAPGDAAGIRAVFQTFYESGFAVRASPTYADLMTATDRGGLARSFLASEALYSAMRDLELRNLVVPVVGDFGGGKAIRAVAGYLKGQGAVVGAFYLSNVEQYLEQDGTWGAFCRNVATLPLDGHSTFIRSASGGGGYGRGPGFVSSLGGMADEVRQGCGGS